MAAGDPQATETAASGRAAPATPLARGSTLGRYLVLDKLGEGGMGLVYAAYDPDLDRKVALKLLRIGGDPDARRRLLGEGRAMARLSHPNVVTVFEVGTDGDRDFVAMEHVDGPTLKVWLAARRPEAERSRPAAEQFVDATLSLFVDIGRGLAAAHGAGLVHRDLKPANVLIGTDGRARVGDFGIARAIDESVPTSRGATTGDESSSFFGTPAYMSPEQLCGDAADARSDQFAFAVALYEALYGARPFGGRTMADIELAHGAGVRTPDADSPVPAHVRRTIERALALDPEDRFPDMNALLESLRGAPRSRGRRAAVAAVAAASLIAGLVVMGNSGDAQNSNRCADVGDRLAGVWDRPARERSLAAFRASGVPYADDAHSSFAGALDAYAADWADGYRATCRATYEDEVQDESVHALRLSCLQDRLSELRSLTRVFAQPRPDEIDRAAQAAAALPAIDDCADAAALAQGIAPPVGSDQTYEVAVLRTDLARARTFEDVGRLDDAAELAEQVTRRAREVDYRPLRAEAYQRLASIEAARGNTAAARTAFEEATLLAEEAGYALVRARALVGLAELVATTSSDRGAIERAARQARAAALRSDEPAELEGRLLRALATAAMASGDVDGARARMAETIEVYRAALSAAGRGGAHARVRFELAAALAQYADFSIAAGDHATAQRAAAEALAMAEEDLGAEHPVAIRYVEVLGWARRTAGDCDGARDAFARARRFYDSERGRQIAAQTPPEMDVAPVTAFRSLRGTVVDASGAPIAGAQVTVARWLAGDSRYAYASFGGAIEQQAHVRIAVTDAEGRFDVDDVPAERVVAIAEHDDHGRARPVHVAGDAVAPIELALRPFGSLRGRVLDGGEAPPRAELQVQVSYSPASSQVAAMATVAADGRFEFERLPEGRYELFFGRMGRQVGANVTLSQRSVTIAAGETLELDVDMGRGTVDIEVAATGAHGAALSSAQVVLFEGRVSARSAGDINRQVLKGARVWSSFVSADRRPAAFPRLAPGAYSACVVPLGGDYRDPEYRRKLHREDSDLASHCFPIEIAPAPATQHYRFEVPPMQILGDDD